MSLKSVWLDARQIKNLYKDVEFIGSKELKDQLKDAIDLNEGAYLINILNDAQILELEGLKKDWLILTLSF